MKPHLRRTAPVESLKWYKSTRSNPSGNCVEIAIAPDGIAIRDSKNPLGGIVHVSTDAFRSLVAMVKTY